ncbi:MAG: VirB4 family type IV secretion system protein [Lachnospiraceae bacterium]
MFKNNQNEILIKTDPALLRKIAPAGGIYPYISYIKTGTGFEACIHIWDFPNRLNDYWLSKICNLEETIVSVDVHTEDIIEVKKNLNRSIEEQNSRKSSAADFREFYDAEKREEEMKRLFDEIDTMGEVVKSVQIRIYAAAMTRAKLENRIEEILKALESDSYRAALCFNEERREWQSIYYPESKMQEIAPHQMSGFAMSGMLLAAGNPFHYSSLEDPYGAFLGETACGGNVIFDANHRNETRVNGNAVVVGKQRFGKSTLLKKILKERTLRGDYTRIFDIVGEFTQVTLAMGGKVLNMDGTDGIINLLEIFKAGETQESSYARHIGKIRSCYCFLKPEASAEELSLLRKVIDEFYTTWGLDPVTTMEEQIDGSIVKREKQISGLRAAAYPIFSDLLQFMTQRIENVEKGDYTEMQQEVVKRELLFLDNIRGQIEGLVKTYGYIFNGYTSVDNLKDVKTVTYNLSGIKDLEQEIFDLQLFNILTLSWDDAVTNGAPMKELWESEKIAIEDVTRYLLLIDESHRWVNAKKRFALELISYYAREGPKFFASIWLASQSIRDYVPEGSDEKGIETLKTIFELSQYKFIFRQDSNAISIIDRVFDNALTYVQRDRIPSLERGQTILCISGDQNIEFKVYLPKSEERLFAGGA